MDYNKDSGYTTEEQQKIKDNLKNMEITEENEKRMRELELEFGIDEYNNSLAFFEDCFAYQEGKGVI